MPDLDATWKNVNNCGTSIYPDSGEGLPPLGRIVGGESAREYEFPYQVGLWSNQNQLMFCGAALITYRWILTAAHCVDFANSIVEFNTMLEIRIGDFHLVITGEKEKARRADKIIIHEDYDPVLVQNNIALVRMNRRVGNAQGRIRPICRPEAGEDFIDSTAIVSGWGSLTSNTVVLPIELQYAPAIILSNPTCISLFPFLPIESSMVCTSDGENNDARGACFGDGGSPVAVKTSGRFQLVGLVSVGLRCAQGYPDVNTRITSYLDWIDANL